MALTLYQSFPLLSTVLHNLPYHLLPFADIPSHHLRYRYRRRLNHISTRLTLNTVFQYFLHLDFPYIPSPHPAATGRWTSSAVKVFSYTTWQKISFKIPPTFARKFLLPDSPLFTVFHPFSKCFPHLYSMVKLPIILFHH